VEAPVEGRRQPLDIVENALVQVARVGVEHRRLPADRLDHPRVAMADMRHIVVAVEIPPPVRIPQPDALAPHQMHRVIVEERHVAAEQPLAAGAQGLRSGHGHTPLCAVDSPASSAETIFCTSAAVMTSGGERMTLAPDVRTITPSS